MGGLTDGIIGRNNEATTGVTRERLTKPVLESPSGARMQVITGEVTMPSQVEMLAMKIQLNGNRPLLRNEILGEILVEGAGVIRVGRPLKMAVIGEIQEDHNHWVRTNLMVILG